MEIALILIASVLVGLVISRYWYVPFLRNPARIDIDKLGLKVVRDDRRQKVKDILTAFFGGFNAMLSKKTIEAAGKACDEFPKLFRPFAQEGAAMAFSLKALFSLKYSTRNFNPLSEALGKHYFIMHYIGIGFWCGMAFRWWPSMVKKISERLDPFYKYLCFDGFGFSTGLFQYLKNKRALDSFSLFKGYETHACYQGFGRSLWFLYMDDPASIRSTIANLDEEYRRDCYAGIGLAVLFTNLNAPNTIFDVSDQIESEHLRDYFLGATLTLYSRRMMDADYLDECLQTLSPSQRTFLQATLQSCDRRFDEVVALNPDNPYQEWRQMVSEDIQSLLPTLSYAALSRS